MLFFTKTFKGIHRAVYFLEKFCIQHGMYKIMMIKLNAFQMMVLKYLVPSKKCGWIMNNLHEG